MIRFSLQVLAGGSRWLREKRVEVVYLEWSPGRLKSLGIDPLSMLQTMRSMGYKLVQFVRDAQIALPPDPTDFASLVQKCQPLYCDLVFV